MFFISLTISEKEAFAVFFLANKIILLFPRPSRFCRTASLSLLFILFLLVALRSILLETTNAIWGDWEGTEEKLNSFRFCVFPFFATKGMSLAGKRRVFESILNCELFAAL